MLHVKKTLEAWRATECGGVGVDSGCASCHIPHAQGSHSEQFVLLKLAVYLTPVNWQQLNCLSEAGRRGPGPPPMCLFDYETGPSSNLLLLRVSRLQITQVSMYSRKSVVCGSRTMEESCVHPDSQREILKNNMIAKALSLATGERSCSIDSLASHTPSVVCRYPSYSLRMFGRVDLFVCSRE